MVKNELVSFCIDKAIYECILCLFNCYVTVYYNQKPPNHYS